MPGSNPVKADYTLPIAYGSAYAAATASQWVVGNRHGVVLYGASLSGTPRYLGLGEAWSIAGGTGRVAIATATGLSSIWTPVGRLLKAQLSSQVRSWKCLPMGLYWLLWLMRMIPSMSPIELLRLSPFRQGPL